jgi:hypothetical protein
LLLILAAIDKGFIRPFTGNGVGNVCAHGDPL